MTIPLLDPTKWWECPECHAQHVTKDPRAITPMHPCASLKGLMAPYVQVHTNAGIARGAIRLVAVAREDYVGGESGLRADGDGRVMSAVRTERHDGSNDCHVFPGTATASGEANY